ncbi:RHS domain-containing protein [Streptomyces kronopolitis]|nr:RHS domain-containing protein [Streptomyces kronopolitis]
MDDSHTGRRTFNLDRAGRVTAVHATDWTETYAYDAAGNQTHATWPDRHPNPSARGARTYTGTTITRAGRIRYEHDALGRVTLRQKTRLSRKPDSWHYAWNAEDRLTSVVTPDGITWHYLYDPTGRRIAKQQLATDLSTIVEQTDFTWDGPTLTEQTTHSSFAPKQVVLTWDYQGLTPLSQLERKIARPLPLRPCQRVVDERFFFILPDPVGTPTELIDETGSVAWHARNSLWGTTAWNVDADAYTPLRSPGQYFDPETQLHYNLQRYYDPSTARYLTLDPLGLSPGPNPSCYVSNPHSAIDPYGLSACPKDVALGIREEGLRKFAESNNFTHYLDNWDWESEVRSAAHNSDVNLHVAIDGFKNSDEAIKAGKFGDPADRFMRAYSRGMGDNWFATEREMYHIGKAVRLGDRTWDSIKFYDQGRQIQIPEPGRWPMPGR